MFVCSVHTPHPPSPTVDKMLSVVVVVVVGTSFKSPQSQTFKETQSKGVQPMTTKSDTQIVAGDCGRRYADYPFCYITGMENLCWVCKGKGCDRK